MFADDPLRGSRLCDVKLEVTLSLLQESKRIINIKYARENISVRIVGAPWQVRG